MDDEADLDQPPSKRVRRSGVEHGRESSSSESHGPPDLSSEETDETRRRLTFYEPLPSLPEQPQSGNSYGQYFTPPESLRDIGITELLDQDCRPTFVLDLQPESVKGQLNLVFCNRSLRFFDDLRNAILPTQNASSSAPPDEAATMNFREWAMSIIHPDEFDGYLPGHTFHGLYWTCATLRSRWRIVSASHVPNRGQAQVTPRSARPRGDSAPKSLSPPMVPVDLGNPSNHAMLSDKEFWAQIAASEAKFKVLTELNPVGMYYLTPAGNIVYANDMWYQITGHPRGLEGEMSFMNVISEKDHDKITEEWQLLITEKGRRVFPLRLRNPFIDPNNGAKRQKWILASCDQEFEEDGVTLKSIMGCITDISREKHAEADALERASLSDELAQRTEEAARHQKSFQQMAELAPSGMFTFNAEGTITWANSQWYEMTGDARALEEHYPMSFLNFVHKDDHKSFQNQWEKLTVLKQEVRLEMRFNKPWVRIGEEDEQIEETTWILLLALPQLDEKGELTSVFGCTTDISYFKWAEAVQFQHRLEAEESRRQQESFIDMTSHEMRNPLSAILQCADGIVDSLIEYKSDQPDGQSLTQGIIDSNLDAAQTIVLCAQHQKRIIDDVLTLSKLNSTVLHISPIQVHVEATVRRTLKMFEGEVKAHEIKMKFNVEPSYLENKVDWVLCDPVRLTQIFINLLTNAIKFTRSEERREIAVSIGSSTTKPPRGLRPSVKWFPTKDCHAIRDLTLEPEWGDGDPIYLYFAVRDTGRGLSEDEMNRLFQRFTQASPNTHVQYGGSGLGLFISRELTELQGGEIGVASDHGAGSTFAFYIKARKSAPQPQIESSSRTFAKDDSPTPWTKLTDLTIAPTSAHRKLSMDKHMHSSRKRHDYHVLLVEDNLIIQKVTSNQLRNSGCTVHVAGHGEDALSFLQRTALWNHELSTTDGNTVESTPGLRLDVVLMDLEMPVLDGLAATKRIRSLEADGEMKGHVPIIAVTANTRGAQMDQALAAGMDDIVPKPFQISELMNMIARLLDPR
ncbi:hypothetical protein BP6252_08069 [Coleophoma cylindrospora]|uniref:Uncharacterized protein n=1 Tax=Coleophoma cylindrospora TaxID=1849047 RepID=A0A3D8RC23_9HELO|nr:hypothetical protein BP6252_08069 [Coleophoma cylindrospora]